VVKISVVSMFTHSVLGVSQIRLWCWAKQLVNPLKPVAIWVPLTGTLTLSPERQSARISKITNDGLTRSGTGCVIAVPIWQQ